jgi:hypothetical protein
VFVKYKKSAISIGNGNELVRRFKNSKFEIVIGLRGLTGFCKRAF